MTTNSPEERSILSLDTPRFWAWLAGFSDGEGCFLVSKNGSSYYAKFHIALRADDWPILMAVRDRSAIGSLTGQFIKNPLRPNSNPLIKWEVRSFDECLALIDGFNAGGGLWAKKSRDFALWSEAVRILDVHGGGANSPMYDRLGEIKAELHAVKRYDPSIVDGCTEEFFVGRNGAKATVKRGRSSSAYWVSDKSARERQYRQLRYSKVTQPQIDEIVRRVGAGERRYVLAREFGISGSMVTRFMSGKYIRRDGTLEAVQNAPGVPATSSEFWKTEAGERAKRSNASIRGKLSQPQIDELVERHKNGESIHSLAKAYDVSRPLVRKFIDGNYIRRD